MAGKGNVPLGETKLDYAIAENNSCLSCHNLMIGVPWKRVPFVENSAHCRLNLWKSVGEAGIVTLRVAGKCTINAIMSVPERYKTIARHCGGYE